MKSFKYKGTPEQMAKVAEWCITNGAEWFDEDRSGVFMEYQDITNDVCYFDMEDWYRKSEKEELTPALELEIFGKTDRITGKTEHPWEMNTGKEPDGVCAKIDVKFSNGGGDTGHVRDFWWGHDIDQSISHWRLHTPDAKYYVQPATSIGELLKPKKPMCLEDAYDTPTYTDDGNYKEDMKVASQLTERVSTNGAISRNKYMREIKPGVWVDVYDVIRAFTVTDGALQHLLKKALAVGQRGHKDAATDYKDILDSAKRAQEIYLEWNK